VGSSEVVGLGMDCCDYPLDTVPKAVDRILKFEVSLNVGSVEDGKLPIPSRCVLRR
jgi:isocitrate lyase